MMHDVAALHKAVTYDLLYRIRLNYTLIQTIMLAYTLKITTNFTS